MRDYGYLDFSSLRVSLENIFLDDFLSPVYFNEHDILSCFILLRTLHCDVVVVRALGIDVLEGLLEVAMIILSYHYLYKASIVCVAVWEILSDKALGGLDHSHEYL